MTALYFDVLRPQDRGAVKPPCFWLFAALWGILRRQGHRSAFRGLATDTDTDAFSCSRCQNAAQ